MARLEAGRRPRDWVHRLLLAGGHKLEVRHYHAMSTVPCLSPGEEVKVQPS